MPIETFDLPDHYDEPDAADPQYEPLLKTCPFCGGMAERIDIDEEGDNFGGSCIQCMKCGASSAVHFDRKENLHSSWNDRPEAINPPHPAPEGEDLSHDFDEHDCGEDTCVCSSPAA